MSMSMDFPLGQFGPIGQNKEAPFEWWWCRLDRIAGSGVSEAQTWAGSIHKKTAGGPAVQREFKVRRNGN